MDESGCIRERAFNVRHGLTPEDDYNVPKRLTELRDTRMGLSQAIPLAPVLEG